MALSPLRKSQEHKAAVKKKAEPSKAYRLNFDTGEMNGLIDGRDAVCQFVRKTLSTARYRYLAYNSAYGSELETLIGQDVSGELLQTEIPRLIKEALLYDDRVKDVKNFVVQRAGDRLYVSFSVDSVFGPISEEVMV